MKRSFLVEEMDKKVLIVDDEPNILTLMVQTLGDLENMGVRIFVARDGLEALEIIERERPGIVLLDIAMPKMNGLEVCRKVKKNPRSSSTYIIMFTARSDSYSKQEAREAGADQYIAKPFDPDEVVNNLKAILDI